MDRTTARALTDAGYMSDKAYFEKFGARKGDWMQTFSGHQFWPLDPRPHEVHVNDIAHGLSNVCRFAGHCLKFYSVAEHSVLMARQAPAELRRWALLHDASEAYVGDVIRPLKPLLDNYKAIEAELMRVIALRFELPWPIPPEIKHLDNCIILDEQAQIMRPPPVPWDNPGWELGPKPLGVKIECWAPARAELEFLTEWNKLGGA